MMKYPTGKGIDRRKLLKLGLVTAASAMIPGNIFASVEDEARTGRVLCFYNLYTYEKLESVYWRDGEYVPESLADINHILRDIRTGRVKPINKKLLDLLYSLHQKLENREPYHIISGYRTPESNALLRKTKPGVARKSFHMYGKAIDIRIPGLTTRLVRKAAMELKGGGVGYYPRSKFIHIDVGPVRYWRG